MTGSFFFFFLLSLAFAGSHSHLKLMLEQQVSTENICLSLLATVSAGEIDAPSTSQCATLNFSHARQPPSGWRAL